MARMMMLFPPPEIMIDQGPFSLVATEAGRYASGLRFTCETWNGQCLHSDLVLANNLAPYVASIARQHAMPPDSVERALLDLVVAIEGLLRHRRASRQASSTGSLPEIELTPEITEVANQTEAALLTGSTLYQHARRLVVVAPGMKAPKGLTRPEGIPLLCPVTGPLLAELASLSARFYTMAEEGRVYCRPPAWLMQTLLARPDRPFPPLEGIVHAPTLRPDGSVLEEEGYDPDTGLYLDCGGLQYPSIPPSPGLDQARAALDIVQDPFIDFPFAELWHRSATLAMVLSLLCRSFIDGSVPLGGITAHGRAPARGCSPR